MAIDVTNWNTARVVAAVLFTVGASTAAAQTADSLMAAHSDPACGSCAEWNAPQQPFRVFGNTYYVGPHGLSAILITSPAGHVLIDGGLPESAREIAKHIAALGFRLTDVKLILNSHTHDDHAGGIAALQAASGARVVASAPSAETLRRGAAGPDDPQFGETHAFPAVATVSEFGDGDTLRVGSLAVVAHRTAGHTRGGTTWTWRSCEQSRCLDLVYADSQTPISAERFRFTTSATYPHAVDDFRRGHAVIESLRCDILMTPHPDASSFWQRVGARDGGNADALIDGTACRRYAENARAALDKRIALEQKTP